MIGIGCILVINGNIAEFPSLEVGGGISHRLKGPKSPQRLISFFELLGTYFGIRLWAPRRLGNNDLTWLEIPITKDNLGNDFTISKLYSSSMLTSWMLQELAVHSLTTNTAIVSKHTKGDSGKRSIWADKLSRNVYTQVNRTMRRAPGWEDPNFWFANLKDISAMWILRVLSLKGEKRLAKSLPSKGGGGPRCLRSKN